MSWEEDNRPVDSFVRAIRYVLDDFQDICTGCMMNNSSAAHSSLLESITVAFKIQAGINDIDPCKTKDYFDDTLGFKGQPNTGIHRGFISRTDKEDYRGQERHCCDSVKSCYNNVDQTLINVRLQGALKQNMHQACRRVDEKLHTVNNCVETKLGMCYKINTRDLENDFEDFKQKIKAEFDKHCENLPPERITSKPESPPTTTQRTTTLRTTVLPTETTETTNGSTSQAATTQGTVSDTTETPHTSVSTIREPVGSTKFEAGTTDIAHVSVNESKTVYPNITVADPDAPTVTTDGLTFSTAFKSSKAINNVSESTNTEPKPRPVQTTDVSSFSTSVHNNTDSSRVSTDPSLQHPSSDNTVIIVSAVCSGILLILAAVIFLAIRMRKTRFMEKCGDCSCPKGIPCKLFQRYKPPPGPQDEIYAEIDDSFMQAVYEFDKKKDPHPNLKNRVQTNAHVNVCYSSADDGMITSTKSRGPTLQLGTRNLRQIPKQNTYQTSSQLKGSLEKSTKKDFVFSHPTFTDPRGTEAVSDEYVQISEKYESIEQVYDQPKHHNRTIPSISERNDAADKNEYDHIVKNQSEEVYSEPDYINSGVTQNNDHLYGNEKIGNYEITQSRF